MAADSKLSNRALSLLRKLSTRGRKSALDYIEYLAEREDIVLPEDEEALREDLAAAKAARKSNYRDTLTVDEVRQQLNCQ
ncbi:MAG: hypothetical protein ABFD96_21310 [Armatimonadia bacterium]